ncbi:potassium channel family protein [Natrialbaceae archaeon GCM10025810]|uniref:potassium channel family protein n=1 Tax=Halovalidus salilacus TaxID=3075124 RepID=UPI003618A3A2
MNTVFLALGVILLAVSIGDLLWTTLWVEGGAGPLTARLMGWTWTLLQRLGALDARVRTLAGPTILVIGLSGWILLLWAGWTFVFASADGALLDTVGTSSHSWSDLIYFTGYTIFTLGIGDLVPRGDVWRLATTLATASGMLFITLTVTYVLSVLGAVTQKRAFASSVSGLGERGDEIVRTSWDGEEFTGLDVTLNGLASQLNTLTENHKAYPILHYFHSARSSRAPATSIAVLDEALTLLRFGIPEQDRPNEFIVRNARSSVNDYLETLQEAFIRPADRTPPPPDLEALRDADVPIVSEREFEASLADLDERRRTLLALVESDVRRWPSADRSSSEGSDT